jgi:hypothetical protein
MKKTWQAPQLIVLVRSRSEEAVLGVCKAGILTPSSPSLDDNNCEWQGCSWCAVQQPS